MELIVSSMKNVVLYFMNIEKKLELMIKLIRKFIFLLFLFANVVLSFSCLVDNKIKKQFEDFHEDEMKSAVQAFYDYVDSNEIFWKQEEGKDGKFYIAFSDEFDSVIKKIIDIHNEYHNSQKLPRNSKEWKNWMHYANKKNKKMLTVSPFCLAEQAGSLKQDETAYSETKLFEYKIDKQIYALLEIMRNDEIKKIMGDINSYMQTGKMFGDKENGNYLIGSIDKDNNTYYAYATEKFVKMDSQIKELHDKYHRFYFFDGAAVKTLFYYFDVVGGRYFEPAKPITCCPKCVAIYEAVKNGKFTKDMDGYSWSTVDEYIWKNNNFGLKNINDFADRKNKEKKEAAERKRIDDMPLHNLYSIQQEVNDNKLVAKDKYDGKRLKIIGQVDSIEKNYVELKCELLFDIAKVYLYLPASDLKKLHRNQTILFLADVKFISGSLWDDDWEDNGGSGYILKNGQLLNSSDLNLESLYWGLLPSVIE